MHEVDQDVVVMYTLVKIFYPYFKPILRFMSVMRVYVGYLLSIKYYSIN